VDLQYEKDFSIIDSILYSMPEAFTEWFLEAEEDIDAAEALFHRKNYGLALFHTQQADEKISKGLLLRTGFLSVEEENELVKAAREASGLRALAPIKYGHEWHAKLVKVLEVFVGSFDNITSELVSKRIPDNPTIFSEVERIRQYLPDFRERINKAKNVKGNPAPSVEELTAVIAVSHERLDSLDEAEREMEKKFKKISRRKKEQFFKEIEKEFKAKVDGPTLEKIKQLMKMDMKEFFKKRLPYSQTLIVLAILNVYLLPHYQAGRYPNSQNIVYDGTLPIIQKFHDILSLLRRCIVIAKS
jgi:predicted GIY-YIG superfamily endonuclease